MTTPVAMILKPRLSFLLVEEDQLKQQTSGGIFMPDGSQAPWTGTILDAGPLADESFYLGRRVMWRARGGVLVGLEGVGSQGAIRILHSSQVLAFLDAEDLASLPSAEWARHAQALPGELLVERVEMPVARGRVQIPDNARLHVRSNEVLVRAIGEGVEGFEIGQRCLVSQMIGDELRFGDRDEIRLWRTTPDQILADVLADEEALRSHDPDPYGEIAFEPGIDQEEHLAFDEGDTRGLQ